MTCLTCGTPPHLNAAGQLPPVDCPLIISVDGLLRRARRTGHIESKGGLMEYELDDGSRLEGRFAWTYP